jgi:hypothetical protein
MASPTSLSAWPGIILKQLIRMYSGVPVLLFAILSVAVFQPDNAYTIISFEMTCRALDPCDADHGFPELSYICQSRMVFGAYAATSLSYQGFRFLWWCTKAAIAAGWHHQLIAVTTLSILSCIIGFTNAFLNVAVLALRMQDDSMYYLHRSRWLVIDIIKSSTLARVFIKIARSVMTAGFKVAGRKTYNELDCFKHPNMDPRTQIRLLDVRLNIPFLPIRAALVAVDINNPPYYEAVSYTWDSNPREYLPVAINGMQLSVPRNVHDIMTRLGGRFSPRFIWIDAICINQEDTGEKVHQIKLMRHVYRRASRVLVCLEKSRKSGYALELLTLLAHMRLRFGAAKAAKYIMSMWNGRQSSVGVEANICGLLELLDHRWFERSWVIQEVVFASEITLYLGDYPFDWEYFLIAVDFLTDPTVPQISALLQSSTSYWKARNFPYSLSHSIAMTQTRNVYQEGRREPLHIILRRFMAFKATKPHDKIFALLGFIDGDLDHIINYKKSISEVLVEIAKYLLDEGHLVHVLHLAGTGYDILPECHPTAPSLQHSLTPGDPLTLPSWVTDWSASRAPRTLAQSFHHNHLRYRASWGQAGRTHISRAKPYCLRITGLVVDHIRRLGSPSKAPSEVGGRSSTLQESQFILEWLDEAQTLAPGNFEGQSIDDTLMRIIFGDRSQTDRPLPSHFIATARSSLEASRRIIRLVQGYGMALDGQISGLEAHLEQHPELFQDLVGFSQSEPLWQLSNYQRLICDPEYPRRFCVTAEGRIGIVPYNTRDGDVVAVLYGAEVPFIIRPKDTEEVQFELVGECYIHGLMDGEALTLGLPVKDLDIV